MWYLNADSGFYAVAYYNPGVSQTVIPKQNVLSLDLLKTFLKLIGTSPASFEINNFSNQLIDTIQYYSPSRKVLMYPLTIGSRWIELTAPFYRERFINKQQSININGKNYYCYKIESNWTWIPNVEFTDYVDLNSGLVMREIIADSMIITPETNPDSGVFVKSTTISKLVREKK